MKLVRTVQREPNTLPTLRSGHHFHQLLFGTFLSFFEFGQGLLQFGDLLLEVVNLFLQRLLDFSLGIPALTSS